MSVKKSGWIDEALRETETVAPDLQPWPDYFKFKAEELRTILNFCEFSDAGSILEVGCGNGFTSYLLSKKAGRVEAFDLPRQDSASHSVGIRMAGRLAVRMRAGNMNVTGGSVTDMPYRDGSFDVVFSQYMLHYVKDKKRALGEMRRVLTDKGVMVTIVPNFTERIFVPLIKYEYIISRLIAKMTGQGAFAAAGEATGHSADTSTPWQSRKISRILNDYILLRPDGAYRNYFEEMISHWPGTWIRLLEESGFKVRGVFSTQMMPLGLFAFLGSSGTRLLSGKIHSLTRAIGGLPILNSMGYSLGIIAVKN
ncbi:MAG: class I SAM-dependent methyltransferase [Candidatus Omnitrophica bacterium]|nr:class I SAM-dependent methyltransferase [Candidatus Omnitrophota bacterium]MBU0895892.1 class I SAM-dependent methyltransferase [Candidatus Omnitrophota bacterium]MBU1808667.1 class I SAM-dependent methyltransferase [Candidatus Omnitrophota bacterium]